MDEKMKKADPEQEKGMGAAQAEAEAEVLAEDLYYEAAEEESEEITDLVDAITADEEELEEAKVDLKDTLLQAKESELNEVIESVYAIDIAIALEEFTDDELLRFYGRIDDEHMAAILEQMDEDLQQRFVGLLGYRKILSLFTYMSNDDIADIVGDMPTNRSKDLMKMMKGRDTAQIQSLLNYEDDSAGGIMTTEYLAIDSSLNIAQTLRKIKEIGPKTEVIETIFVVDRAKKLIGTADLRDILIAKDNEMLTDIMDDNIVTATPEMDQEEVARLVSKYDLKAIPVVNRRGALIGIVTVDDIIDVLVEEQDEDIIRMGGGTESEDIDEPVKDSVRKRLPWLAILFGLSMLVSSVVGKFEVVLAVLPLAMAFQSLVLDMAGNVGTQSLAVTIRALTDDSLTASDKLKLVFKELRVGLLNGLILGVLAFVGVGAYIYVFKTHDLKSAFAISACIGTALIVAMMISSFVGSGIPMLFKKIGVDPAVASGPLITTLNDMVAVVCYYGLIWILLINVMNVSF